jgi:hypothetical protein
MPRTVIFDEIGEADVLQIVEEPIIEPAEGEYASRSRRSASIAPTRCCAPASTLVPRNSRTPV